MTSVLLWHKADIFQAERSLVISDVVFDKKMLTKEKLYCQMNEKLRYSAVCSALLNQGKVPALGFSRLSGYMCIVLFLCLKPLRVETWDTKSSDFLHWGGYKSQSEQHSTSQLPWSCQHSWTQTPACACTQQGCSLDNPSLHSWESFPVCTSILLPSGTSPAQPNTCVPPCLCWNSTSSIRLEVCIGNIPLYEN